MANTASVVTPAGYLNFPYLTQVSEKGRYEAGIVFPPGTDVSGLQALVDEALAALPDSEPKGAYRNPLNRDGAEKSHLGGHFVEGAKFFTGKTKFKPQLLDSERNDLLDPQNDLYPGAVVRLLVHAFTYNTDGNRGVGFGLDGVQKVGDAERVAGGPNAAAAFEESGDVDVSDLIG